jgi:hypothetical protein
MIEAPGKKIASRAAIGRPRSVGPRINAAMLIYDIFSVRAIGGGGGDRAGTKPAPWFLSA